MKKIILILFINTAVFSQNSNQKLDSIENLAWDEYAPLDKKIAALLYLGEYYTEYDNGNNTRYTDALLKIARSHNKPIAYGHYYMIKANEKMFVGEFKSAEKYATKSYHFYLKEGKTNDKITASYAKIFALDFQSKFNEAKKLALTTLKKYERLPDNSKIGEIYYYLSTVFNENKQPQSAFEYINKAMIVFRKDNNTNGIFKCHYQIASIFYLNRMYDKAENYIDNLYKDKNKHLLSKVEYQLKITELRVNTYLALKKYKLALPYAKDFLSSAKKINSTEYNYIPQFRLAETLCGLKEYTKALSLINPIDDGLLNDAEKLDLYYILGKIYFGLQDYTKSNFYFQKNYNVNPDDADYIKSLAEVSFKLKNYPRAYQLLEKYNSKEIALLNTEKKSQVADYESLYQVNEKNLELKDKELELSKAQLEVQNRNNFIRNLVVVLSFVTLLLVFSLFIYFSRKKVTQILARKNTQLEGTNYLLQNSLAEKEILLKEIHHRVKNNLQIVMSLLNIQAQNETNINLETFLDKSRSRIATMALVHQNLYLSDSLSFISFKQYIEELTEYIKSSFDQDNVAIHVKADGVNLNIDTAIPLGLIINELVSNALKHAFTNVSKNNSINITLNPTLPNHYSLTIEDNGIGLSTQLVKKSKSIGLELVELLVLQLQGTIARTCEQGTRYQINFKT